MQEWREQIKNLIEENGPMGVNAIQRSLDIPLSTLQYYLDKKQDYFRKNDRRQWDLPQNIMNSTNTKIQNNNTIVIESQIAGIRALADSMMAQMDATLSLMSVSRQLSALPVAEKAPDMDQRLIDLDKRAKEVREALKTHVKNVPEEYVDLILNVDQIAIVLKYGQIFSQGEFNDALVNLVTGSTDTLPQNILEIIESHQMEIN